MRSTPVRTTRVRSARARAALAERPGPLRRRVVVGLAAALALSGLGGPVAVPAHAAGALDQLREFARTTPTARGEFSQQLVRGNGRPGQSTAGNFAFARPGKFRWEVVRPYEQLIVTDGEKLFFYDKDLRQVTVRKVSEAVSATPAAILFGSNDLDASFTLRDIGERDGLAWLEALPKSREAGFERIQIGFRDGLPVEMEVRDSFNQVTRFAFRGIERNPKLDPAIFRFTAPKGVDVVQ